MEQVIQILMRRDGISYNEAYAIVQNCILDLKMAIDYDDAEQIVADYLGLEPDYIEVLLYDDILL